MIVVMMGVSGCGKTTVGQLYARIHGWKFLDADAYHSPANIAKMREGIPLQDEDRWPWLDRLNSLLKEVSFEGTSVVLACSALKQRYRDRIARDLPGLRWIYLKGSFELIEARLKARTGHYMKAGLLESQFAALEEPGNAVTLDIAPSPADLVKRLGAALEEASSN